MTNIKLTIAIPTYNGASTIKQTLDTICLQLQDGVDILISDNASTDETPNIITEYQSKYPQIHYYRNETNLGPDKNFDLAIRRSLGEFVWLFSDDDLLNYGAISKNLGIITAFPEIGAIFTNYSVHNPNMECTNPKVLNIDQDKYCNNGTEFLAVVDISPIFCSSNIVKRSSWVSFDNSAFLGTAWIHYASLTAFLVSTPAFCIAEPQVKLITRARWNTKGIIYKNTLTLASLINNLKVFGYNTTTINHLLSVIAKPLPLTAARAMRDGMVFTWSLLGDTVKNFGFKHPLITSFTILELILPNHIFQLIWMMIGKIKMIKVKISG